MALTNAQIDGSAANAIGYTAAATGPWERAILHAMHNYGAYATITCGRACGDRVNIYLENGTQYAVFGGTWPVSTFNWASSGNNGALGSVPTNWRPGGLSWSTALQIVNPRVPLRGVVSERRQQFRRRVANNKSDVKTA